MIPGLLSMPRFLFKTLKLGIQLYSKPIEMADQVAVLTLSTLPMGHFLVYLYLLYRYYIDYMPVLEFGYWTLRMTKIFSAMRWKYRLARALVHHKLVRLKKM